MPQRMLWIDMPIVSVIVPNYNHAPYLRQRMESILGQSFQDFEVIVIDDCSSDKSHEVIESYRSHPKVSQIVYNKRNSGSAFQQWDKGIALARGEWLWIAESDDWAEPQFLETMMQAVNKSPTCGLAYCWSYRTDEQGNLLWEVPDKKEVKCYRGEAFIREKLVLSNVLVNVSACLFRRELFKPEYVSLYEQMRLCGDWLFYVLLAEQSDVVVVKTPLNYCRRHGTNISESAEAKGLTFLEGADVLDYILKHHPIKNGCYARYWGRQWAKYRRIWSFSKETDKAIRRRFAHRHLLIISYYYIYRIKFFLRQSTLLNLKQN